MNSESSATRRRPALGTALAALTLIAGACSQLPAADLAHFPAPAVDQAPTTAKGKQTAVLSGGCFWCAEAVFEQLAGVSDVTSGYTGGTADQAHYEMVGSGKTNHAESIRIAFDPAKITYGQLLRIFFSVAHDPTQLNRQGPDVGSSYRSVIFYVNDEQRRLATAYIAQLDNAKIFPKSIVTQVTPLKGFYRAEDYHQDYALHHPDNPYIQVCDRPKIEMLKQEFPDLFVEYAGTR